jgi:hypothetical protein
MPSNNTRTLVPSAARTANGDSGPNEYFPGGAVTVRAQLAVTAASGTSPTLNVVIEDSLDGTNWYTVGTFAQKTGTGVEVINITGPVAETTRVRWTVGGTSPNFTVSVVAVARFI